MAYPGEYRREQILGEDGYPDVRSEYDTRSGYLTEAGYGVPYAAQGYEGRPYAEGYEHHRQGHHLRPGYEPEGVYVQPTEESDLGMGLTGGVRRVPVGEPTYVETGYGVAQAGYGVGYGAPTAYGGGGYENERVEVLEEELRKERRRAHEAEAAAAAATAYALHERHERREDEEERYEGYRHEHKHKHQFFD